MIVSVLSGASKPDPKIAKLYQKQLYNIKLMREFIEQDQIIPNESLQQSQFNIEIENECLFCAEEI